MRPLKDTIEEAGYTVVGFDYQSLQGPIDPQASLLRERLDDWNRDPTIAEIHLVTHSLGGLVARAALGEEPPTKVRRCVMLAPPNQGSKLATFLRPMLGGVISTLEELTDDPDGRVHRLPVPDSVEFGVIAARYDHAVSEENSHLQGEKDHVVLPSLHSLLMVSTSCQRQVVYFLQHGSFEHAETEE